MIKVVKTSGKDIKDFSEKEWPAANFEHYGRREKWTTIKHTYKAVEDGKIVGILEAKYKKGILYVEDLLVAQEKRHIGIGELLMRKAEELATKHKAHKIYLETGKDWISEKFYKSLGYKEEALLKNHWVGLDFIIFVKFL